MDAWPRDYCVKSLGPGLRKARSRLPSPPCWRPSHVGLFLLRCAGYYTYDPGGGWSNVRFAFWRLFSCPKLLTEGLWLPDPEQPRHGVHLKWPKCHSFFFFFKSSFYFILEYTWFIMCSLQVYSKVIQLCIYMHLFFFYASILFQMLFPFRLSQNTVHSSLCYTGGPCWLSILYIVVSICET